MGDRAGNFAVQNSDLLLVIGNRLSIRQVGYNWKTWAREAFVIMVDADSEELKKPTIHVELPVHADAKNFLEKYNDISLLADLMGHESIETTRIYLRRTSSEQQQIVDKVVVW